MISCEYCDYKGKRDCKTWDCIYPDESKQEVLEEREREKELRENRYNY